MSPPRSLQFRRDESDSSASDSSLSSDEARDSVHEAGSAERKVSTALDRYAVLRLRQSASSQPGDLADFLAEQSRASSATMSGQF